MASYIFALFFCAAISYQADSLPRWSWGKFAEFETLSPENKQIKDCIDGQCLQAWKCLEDETALEEPTTCSERSGGPWICCIKLLKNENAKFTEKSKEVTAPLIIERRTNNSNTIDRLMTPDWITVALNVERSKEDKISSRETLAEYKKNANIVNWGRSHVYSPKHSHEDDSSHDVSFNNEHKPYVWNKGSTSNPFNRITEDKWLNPVSAELRNKYPLENEYDASPKNSWDKSWDYNHNLHGTKKTTQNRIVKTTPPSRWSSTKSSWNRDHSSSKTTNKWENRATASSWVRPINETRNQVLNSRSTTNTPEQHSWTKSTKSVYDWNYSSNSYGNTKTRAEFSSTSKPRTKSTTQPWRLTTNLEKENKTPSIWVKPTKDSWNWGSPSNSEKKSTEIYRNTPTTRKSTSKISTKASSTTKSIPRVSVAYTSKQAINNRRTTPKSSFTRPIVSTQKPSGVPFENIEKSRSSRMPSAATQSTTKKYTRPTPLPDVNSHKCGIRVTSREAPRRGKRQVESAEVAYLGTEINRTPFQRIVGGTEAEPFSWPWVAALYRVSESGGNRFLSAGTLINKNFVLTAAHVFTPDDLRTASFVVMLGTHTAREAVAEYMVMYVLRHPDYQQRYYYNDIALLRLERPVDFNDYVMPVCLPSPSLPLVKDRDLEGKQVTVMGWGDESYGGKTSRVLKEASFPIVPRKSCNESYFRVASNRFPRGITSNMLCAGDPNGGKDACQGDSGGPLTAVENGRHTQVGIVSFGYQCGDKEYPGVYTKVAPYLSWIAENARCDDYSDRPYYY